MGFDGYAIVLFLSVLHATKIIQYLSRVSGADKNSVTSVTV